VYSGRPVIAEVRRGKVAKRPTVIPWLWMID
jgi:hypothetical protein